LIGLMTDAENLEAFRAERHAAGQPWQQRGVKTLFLGMAALLVAYLLPIVAPSYVYPVGALALSVVLFGVSFGMMLKAASLRRRWAKTHTPVPPGAP
jgi:hypothetical protein